MSVFLGYPQSLTLDARDFGVVPGAGIDNTAALQAINDYVAALTPLGTVVVDLPPGLILVKCSNSTVIWNFPVGSGTGIIQLYGAVILTASNLIWRGNGTTIGNLAPSVADSGDNCHAFATKIDRPLSLQASAPLRVSNGSVQGTFTCTSPHGLEFGDAVLIGGTFTNAAGQTSASVTGYRYINRYPSDPLKFSVALGNTSTSTTDIGTGLTVTALRSLQNIGFVGDLTFDLSRDYGFTNTVVGIFASGVNGLVIDCAFKSKLTTVQTYAGKGLRLVNNKRMKFSDRCSWDTMQQGMYITYCSDVDIGNAYFHNVGEGIDFDLHSRNITMGALRFEFDDAPTLLPDTEKQCVDLSDCHNVYIESIQARNYKELIYIYPKNYWSTYVEFLQYAGTRINTSPPGVNGVVVNSILSRQDETTASSDRMVLIGWNMTDKIDLPCGNNPFHVDTGTSRTVTFTCTQPHYLSVGDTVTFAGTISSFGGLVQADIIGARTVTTVLATTFQFTAGGSGSTTAADGGGAAVGASTPNLGFENVPAPENVRINSLVSENGGYISLGGGQSSWGRISMSTPQGGGAALRIASETKAGVTKAVTTDFGALSISDSAGSGLSIGGSGSVHFGDVRMVNVTTPVSTVGTSATVTQQPYSVALGPVDTTGSTPVDKLILGLRAGEGAFVIQGYLTNGAAITGNAANYCTVQMEKNGATGSHTIGASAMPYGNASIAIGKSTPLNGNGTDTDGQLTADDMLYVRFNKQNSGILLPQLVADIAMIRYRTN